MKHNTSPLSTESLERAGWMPEPPRRAAGQHPECLPRTLEDLAAVARREIDITRYPAKRWTLPREAPDGTGALDVLIVGASQAGLAVAHGLRMAHVDNIALIDLAPRGKVGPWATYARMPTLRTHKDNGGIECGIPSLSLRAWYEVQHGPGSWEALYKVQTADWADYLEWFRDTAELGVDYDTELLDFALDESGLIAAAVRAPEGTRTIHARKLVLATGIEGNGIRSIPAFVGHEIPPALYAHTQDDIDFAALKGSRVLVLGGGASAYDNAICAAEAGAEVHVFHRMEKLISVNPGTWGEFDGYLHHYIDLPPELKWRFMKTFGSIKGGPPVATIKRALALPNLHIHPGCSWRSMTASDGRLTVEASDGTHTGDFAILGTGYRMELSAVPSLAGKLKDIATWEDMFTPPPGLPGNGLEKAPWLGRDFTFQPKPGQKATWHAHVLNFARGAQLSTGTMPIGLSGIKFGAAEVVRSLTGAFFAEDAELYLSGLQSWTTRDLEALDT
ncbi:FAD-dependent oxidoreductase [Celeribacter indicus]|uniref:FAD/NAD(P)-binding domain-containing protein n=1 Tax=Celeribacter indicus TaxID=1208324 RepID=A0A0B5DXZ3_9RHOB|nr:NAD(P)/FAD-dependent oxidoreductase [Celeribacter indicus]AJE47864.1 hypothetical protein P73_3149 [Celeribacter indicus]SDW25301.1 Predicted flavoprotein CzcO associated with the cation diffusion facilitator CzcD [Celeribacter indicus]